MTGTSWVLEAAKPHCWTGLFRISPFGLAWPESYVNGASDGPSIEKRGRIVDASDDAKNELVERLPVGDSAVRRNKIQSGKVTNDVESTRVLNELGANDFETNFGCPTLRVR